jgi:hypothetical protein
MNNNDKVQNKTDHAKRSFGALRTTLMALAVSALAYTSQAQQYPTANQPGPHSTGYMVWVHTKDKPAAGTDSTIYMSLTFFAPGYHQMYWALDITGWNEFERGTWESFFFPDTYSSQPGNYPYMGLRSDGLGYSPDWLWDVIYVDRYEDGKFINSKSWTWENLSSIWINGGHPWYNFGKGYN